MTAPDFDQAGQGAAPAPSAGFTLLEVLASTLILTLLIGLASFAYSLYLDVWQSRRLADTTAMETYRRHYLTRQALEAIMDYYVTDLASAQVGLEPTYFPSFSGEGDMLRTVTRASVFQPGKPALIRFGRIRDSQDPDYGALVYEEASLNASYLAHAGQSMDFTRRLILLPNLTDVSLRYYGVDTIVFTPDGEDVEITYAWHPAFDGQEKQVLPRRLELIARSDTENLHWTLPIRGRNDGKSGLFNPPF